MHLECTSSKKYSFHFANDIGTLLNLFFQIDPIDLFVKTSDVAPNSSFDIYKTMKEYNHFFPYLIVDLNSIETVTTNDLLRQLQNLSEPIKKFNDVQLIDFLLTKMKEPEYLTNQKPLSKLKNLTPTTRKLFNFFYQNQNKKISITDLSFHLWNETSLNHTKTVYSYIHELRLIIEDNPQSRFKITREGKGIYQLSFDDE